MMMMMMIANMMKVANARPHNMAQQVRLRAKWAEFARLDNKKTRLAGIGPMYLHVYLSCGRLLFVRPAARVGRLG